MTRWLIVGSGACVAAATFAACVLPRDGLLDDQSSGPTTLTGTATGGAGASSQGGSTTTSSSSSSGGTGGSPQSGCDDGYDCVPAVDSGSVVRVLDGQAACDGPWQAPTTYAPPVQPGCACSCGAPTTGNCSPGQFSGYSDDGCQSLIGYAPATGCMPINNALHRAFVLQPSTPSAATCAASSGGPVPLDDSTVCSLAAAPVESCGDGMVCVPQGSGALCNLVVAGSSCAAGYGAPVDIAVVEGDTRSCNCTCGPSAGQTCNASATVYTGGSCSQGTSDNIPANGSCTDTVDAQGTVYFDIGAWTGGSCTPNATAGSVAFGTTVTLCCS